MNKERAREQLKFLRANIDESLQDLKEFKEFHEEKNECVSENHKQRIKECEEDIQALDIAIDSLEHQVNEKDEIKLVCPKCKREWTKPIGEFCSSCGTEMVVESYERKE